MRRFAVLLVLAAGVGVFAAQSSGSSSATRRIDQHAVGGAKLGLRRAAYVRRLGRVTIATRLPGGLKRLTFGRREIDVYLSRAGRGVAILTSAREYRTTARVGPCSSLRALKRAYRKRLAVNRKSRSIVAYRLGRLVFAVPTHHVGVVMLASPKFPVTIAVNAGQCGQGEEGE